MMGKYYQTQTSRSKRKLHNLDGKTVTVELADGKACFQMVLPMSEALFDVARAIEQTASDAGLLLMKGLIDQEVEHLAGGRYQHNADRQAVRWGRRKFIRLWPDLSTHAVLNFGRLHKGGLSRPPGR